MFGLRIGLSYNIGLTYPFFPLLLLLVVYLIVSYLFAVVHLETVNSNAAPQEQMSSFISSLQISKDQSSLQGNDQVAEHGSMEKKSGDISIDKIQPRTNQRSGFRAPDIEELLVDISLTELPYESARGVGRNIQISEGIDPKILQHVANALQYMAGSQTAVDDAKVMSTSTDLNQSLVHTLKAINKKHGDITQGCLLESECMKTVVLLGICKVVQDLLKKQLKDLDGNSLDSYYTAVRDAENLKVDVQWLRSRLDEIRDACKLSDEAKGLVDERDRRVGNIDEMKKELSQRKFDLERLESEVRGIEEQLAREVVMVEELNKKFSDQMSKVSRFQHANLMEGLI